MLFFNQPPPAFASDANNIDFFTAKLQALDDAMRGVEGKTPIV